MLDNSWMDFLQPLGGGGGRRNIERIGNEDAGVAVGFPDAFGRRKAERGGSANQAGNPACGAAGKNDAANLRHAALSYFLRFSMITAMYPMAMKNAVPINVAPNTAGQWENGPS